MLSICTTIKNRSRVPTDKGILYLFPECVKSIARSTTYADDVELVISDWGSTDWPIKEWIEDCVPQIPIRIINVVSDSFSAGKGRNIAASEARGEYLLFLDADMIINSKIIAQGIRTVSNGKVFYPTVKYQIDESGKQIIHEGGGNLFIDKHTFSKTGGWPEYWKYGFEDTDFVERVKAVTEIVTDDTISMFHQWHPQTKLFKDKYAKEDTIVDDRKKHYKDKQNRDENALAIAIELMLNNDPNVTHNKLNSPVKGDNRRFI